MAKILLIGCGSLGRKLALQLMAENHQVIAMKRTPMCDPVPGLDVILADITVQADLEKLPIDIDQIVILLAPSQRNTQAYNDLYKDGLNNVLGYFEARSTIKSKLRVPCLFVSSTSVYAQEGGEWVNEDSPVEAKSFNGVALLAAEQRILSYSCASVVVRFSGIYGPGREGLIRRVREGVSVQYEPPSYTNRIHEQDCIGVLCFLIKRRLAAQPMDNLYLATDSAPVAIGEVVAWLSSALGCQLPPDKKTGATTEVFASQNKRCNNKRLTDLGYQFRYSTYTEGYGELLERF